MPQPIMEKLDFRNYFCSRCGSTDIARPASAYWSQDDQEWKMSCSVGEGFSCGKCGFESDKAPLEACVRVPLPNHDHFAAALAAWQKRINLLKPTEKDFATPEEIEAARLEHASDTVIVDSDAIASRIEEGTWIQAWVYIKSEPA